MRKPFIAGNWKMNLERKSALGLVAQIRDAVGQRSDVDVAVCPPFVYLDEVVRALKGSAVQVGAQNCCDETSGAFTGEISAAMLVDIGCDLVILGHSERRQIYGESSELVNAKVHSALEAGLEVILCVGETRAEREEQRTEKIVGAQLVAGLKDVDGRSMQRLTIAYEPVWAIGTGLNATPEQAGAVHSYLRGILGGLYTDSIAESVRIQYGGSVKPSNVRALMAVPHIDGCLVGGASLAADTFLPLIEFR
ncbi:MAG: triose-phosphate isomerase [Planctomycetota bacterium]|nr:triose-phosphate isomerase [Planctomycetota bacterium]